VPSLSIVGLYDTPKPEKAQIGLVATLHLSAGFVLSEVEGRKPADLRPHSSAFSRHRLLPIKAK